ncbi:Homeodomain-like protein [Halteromyces radiatus]|uniref:Homeodomain-like protein n=1 Tax=Halteromyces radiatus TaxID=101107 RepID=UPI002220C34B|nr:Homeodomain-like protein [Halteromyces radiatus]KAI8098615.1 Homeodomain-like protein [Halteromyces radiatus]
MTTITTNSYSPKAARVFEPVILFHDHTYFKDGSQRLEHIRISSNDPHNLSLIEQHKRKILNMLDINGKLWTQQPSTISPIPSPIPTAVMSTPLPTTPYSPPHTPTNNHYIRRRSSTSHPNTTKKRRGNLPRAVTSVLRSWLYEHKEHPYPTDEEKLTLSRQTNLTLSQVSNWFINARRRILIPMLEEDAARRQPMTFYYEHQDI